MSFLHNDGTPFTQCGDLPFANEAARFRAMCHPDDVHAGDTSEWRVKYRRPGLPDSMALVFESVVSTTQPTESTFTYVLRSNADAIGWRLGINAPAPTPAEFDTNEGELFGMVWRHLDSPILNSATRQGDTVTLGWTNTNDERPFDETRIYRNGVHIATTYGTTSGGTDGPLSPGTYVYTLRHWSTATPNALGGNGNRPNSEASNALEVTITAPPPISAYIDGPDVISSPGKYGWATYASGGVGPPYHYQRPHPGARLRGRRPHAPRPGRAGGSYRSRYDCGGGHDIAVHGSGAGPGGDGGAGHGVRVGEERLGAGAGR